MRFGLLGVFIYLGIEKLARALNFTGFKTLVQNVDAWTAFISKTHQVDIYLL
jgi:hypothetical protein